MNIPAMGCEGTSVDTSAVRRSTGPGCKYQGSHRGLLQRIRNTIYHHNSPETIIDKWSNLLPQKTSQSYHIAFPLHQVEIAYHHKSTESKHNLPHPEDDHTNPQIHSSLLRRTCVLDKPARRTEQ